MNVNLIDLIESLSGRLARDGETQIIARFRNGKQQIYRLTPSKMPRSPTQKRNSAVFRDAMAIATEIYHNAELRAPWQEAFDANPEGYHKLFNYILAKISRQCRSIDG